MWLKFLQRMMFPFKKMPDSFLRFQDQNEVDSVISAMRSGKSVLVFKHSTRCPVSHGAYEVMQRVLDSLPEAWSVYLIDVIGERPLSQYFAQNVGITHQSPQLLYVTKGEFKSVSHYSISKEAVSKILDVTDVWLTDKA